MTRLASIILSVSTFWFGLADNESVSLAIRVVGLGAVVSLQVYMLQRFLTFHLSRRREASRLAAAAEADAKRAKQDKRAKKAVAKKTSEEDISELPEVDQNTNKSLRQRGAVKTKWLNDLTIFTKPFASLNATRGKTATTVDIKEN